MIDRDFEAVMEAHSLRAALEETASVATLHAMLATALRWPLHLLEDLGMRVDSARVHWAWLLSFLGFTP